MLNNKKHKKLQGFSLFELIITLGILMILSTLVFPIALQKVQQTKLESYASQLVTDIYFQQQESFFKKESRGIAIENSRYAIFDGDSLATSTEYQYKSYPSNIRVSQTSFSSGNEIVFPAGEFKSLSHGFLTLWDGFNSINVYINREGLIEYDKP